MEQVEKQMLASSKTKNCVKQKKKRNARPYLAIDNYKNWKTTWFVLGRNGSNCNTFIAFMFGSYQIFTNNT